MSQQQQQQRKPRLLASKDDDGRRAATLVVERDTGRAKMISGLFTDYDTAALVAQNKSYAGSESQKLAHIERMGIFAHHDDIVDAVWKFPIIQENSMPTWGQLPDPNNHKWPVFVHSGKHHRLRPNDFGRGTAFLVKKGKNGRPVYAVYKEEVEGLNVERTKYYGMSFEVPDEMIIFRAMEVVSIDSANGNILFRRRHGIPVETTINSVRSMKKGSKEYDQRRLAVHDLFIDYPNQLSSLLDPGEVEISIELQRQLAYDAEMEAQDADTAAAATTAAGGNQQQQVNHPIQSSAPRPRKQRNS